MKIHIVIQGRIVGEWDLEQGRSYSVGRSIDQDVRILSVEVGRHEGRLFNEGENWFFENKDGEKRLINDDQIVQISSRIDLITSNYFDKFETGNFKRDSFEKRLLKTEKWQKRIIALSGLILLASIVSTLMYFKRRPLEPNTILSQVRSKVVEFQFSPDEGVIKDLKNHGGFENSDFKHEQGFCSGFIVAPELVMTATHCVLGTSGLNPQTHFIIKDHKGIKHAPQKVVFLDLQRDYLVLLVPGLGIGAHLEMSDNVEIGQRVFTVGNVEGEGIAIREGIIAGQTKSADSEEIEFLRYTAAASPGNSGGPLVDEYGNVVGIVFARTWAENYNLATPSKDIIKTSGIWGHLESTSLAKITTRNLSQFSYIHLIESLGLPFEHSWRDYPGIVEKLNHIEVDVHLPSSLYDFSKQVLGGLSSGFLKAYDQVVNEIRKKGGYKRTWLANINQFGAPLVPFSMSIGASKIDWIDERFAVLSSWGFAKPARLNAWQRFLESNSQDEVREKYPINLRIAERIENNQFNVIDYLNKKPSGRITFSDLATNPPIYGRVYLKLQDFENAEFKSEIQSSIEHLFSQKGLLFDFPPHPYFKKNSFKPFNLLGSNMKAKMQLKRDKWNREWKENSWDFLGDFHISEYCTREPVGYICISDSFRESNELFKNIRSENFVKYELSEYLVQPQFWNLDAAIEHIEYSKKKEERGIYSDIEIKKDIDSDSVIIKGPSLLGNWKIYNLNRLSALRFLPVLDGGESASIYLGGIQLLFEQKNRKTICNLYVEDSSKKLFWPHLKEIRDFISPENELVDGEDLPTQDVALSRMPSHAGPEVDSSGMMTVSQKGWRAIHYCQDYQGEVGSKRRRSLKNVLGEPYPFIAHFEPDSLEENLKKNSPVDQTEE